MSTNIPLMYSMFGLAGTGGEGGSLWSCPAPPTNPARPPSPAAGWRQELGYIDVHCSAANWSSGQIFKTSIQISRIIFLFFILGFQKRIASICLKKIHKGYMFLKA